MGRATGAAAALSPAQGRPFLCGSGRLLGQQRWVSLSDWGKIKLKRHVSPDLGPVTGPISPQETDPPWSAGMESWHYPCSAWMLVLGLLLP